MSAAAAAAAGAAGAVAPSSMGPEPEVTGVATLSRVTLSSLALMKIVQHGTRALPELCAGSLLGIDDGKGSLEVSDCFAYPSASSNSNTSPPTGGGAAADEEEADAAQQAESDVTEFRQDMMRLLRDCNLDEFCVGWYRTVNMGDWCGVDLVEQQFDHQEECDQGTGKAKSVLIIYDPYRTEKGVLSLKALRLTDTFMEVMRVRSSGDARVAAASDAALTRMRMEDIFYEIPIELDASSALAHMALTELRITPTGGGAGGAGSGAGAQSNPSQQSQQQLLQQPGQGFEPADVGLDRLVLNTDPYLEKNISFVIEELDMLQEEQSKAMYFQKQVQRQKLLQDKWIAQRKAENQLRAERNEDPLPLRDPNDPMFRPLKDSSKLGSLLVRKQIDIYCEQINSWSAQSLEKLFLVNAFNSYV